MLVAAALASQTVLAESPWTWTLYADADPVVLAHEIPDTANLRATLECDPGSSVARLTLYSGPSLTGMARVNAGEASAVAEATATRGGVTRLAIRTDHPVFAAFAVAGRIVIVIGDQRRSMEVPTVHLAKLRRFAELCSG